MEVRAMNGSLGCGACKAMPGDAWCEYHERTLRPKTQGEAYATNYNGYRDKMDAFMAACDAARVARLAEKPFCGCDSPAFCSCDSRKYQTARGL